MLGLHEIGWCKVQVAGYRLEAAGCRLQIAGQDFTSTWKELDSFFALMFHTYATTQKNPEVEISGSVFVLLVNRTRANGPSPRLHIYHRLL